MDFAQFSSDLPSQGTLVCSSTEENEETMKRMAITEVVRQLDPGKFGMAVAHSTFARADFISDRYNCSVSVALEMPKDSLTVIIPRSVSGDFQVSGEQLGNDKLIVIPGNFEVDIVARGLAGSDCIIFGRSHYIELSGVLNPGFEPTVSFSSLGEDVASLRAFRRAIVSEIKDGGIGSGASRASDLITSMAIWLAHKSGQCDVSRVSFNPRHRLVAKRTQAYLETNYAETIGIDTLCRESGVGVRTLQRCFRKYFDTSISEYLKIIRLDATRRSLMNADLKKDSVTTIAVEHGFTHLGRFSKQFHENYGVLPKQVLERGNKK
jgi:AraC-like DNA-binding protein